MSPEEWRRERKLSQDALARLLGVGGKNPAGTWHKWAHGKIKPPLPIVAKVEALSDGRVSLQSWIKVRNAPAATEYTSITTEDGTVIVRDSETGRTARGRNLEEALAELRRLGMGVAA